jgi:Serine dehydrogenase proteinase
MPNWTALQKEIAQTPSRGEISPHDIVRRKYLAKLHDLTGRNVIAYYSGWLSKPRIDGTEINDEDKNGFMLCVHQLEKKKGLDLILHTPGGDGAATESLIHYLKEMFGDDIRAVVPQIAMSAGSIIACSCKSILMGKQSNIGPVDPQFSGIPAIGVIKEIETAFAEIKLDQRASLIWNPILGRLTPSFVQQCNWAISMGRDLIRRALTEGMFKDSKKENKDAVINAAVERLSDLSINKTHSRHLHYQECLELELNIEMLEDKGNGDLQDLVLTVHHCYMLTLANTPALKIIENHKGRAIVKQQAQVPQNFFMQLPPQTHADLPAASNPAN